MGEKISVSKIDQTKAESTKRMDRLTFEINKLKEQLRQATTQSEEFRRKAAEFESRSLLLSRNETRLRDYEEKIAHLTHELHGKQAQIDQIRAQIANNANVHANSVFVLEKEVANVRNMDNLQIKDNEDLLRVKSEREVERYNNQEAEKMLRAQELELISKIENLKNEIVLLEK